MFFSSIIGFLTPMLLSKQISSTPLKTLVLGLKLKLVTSFIRYLMVKLCIFIYSNEIDLKVIDISNMSTEINENALTQRYIFFYILVITFAAHEIAGMLTYIF